MFLEVEKTNHQILVRKDFTYEHDLQLEVLLELKDEISEKFKNVKNINLHNADKVVRIDFKLASIVNDSMFIYEPNLNMCRIENLLLLSIGLDILIKKMEG